MIFLTKMILKNITDRLLFQRIIHLSKSDNFIKMSLLENKQLINLRITNINFFLQENLLVVELYDGDGYCNALLEESKWSYVDPNLFSQKRFTQEKTEKLLTIGSYIILDEYTFESEIILSREKIEDPIFEFCEYFMIDILKIKDFFVIGFE
jgi:hypothetical protein